MTIALVRQTKTILEVPLPLLPSTLLHNYSVALLPYVPFCSLVVFKYLYFCVRIMDLDIEMYEV